MANRPGVMLFFDDWEPLLSLSDKDLASMLRAAINFSKYGEVPEFSGPLSIIWGIIAAKLERDQARYDKAILQKRHAVYCRITKSKGEDPLDFEEWCEQFLDHSEERTISTDNERSSSITEMRPA